LLHSVVRLRWSEPFSDLVELPERGARVLPVEIDAARFLRLPQSARVEAGARLDLKALCREQLARNKREAKVKGTGGAGKTIVRVSLSGRGRRRSRAASGLA
jgi:hypothetical protein